MIKLIDKEFIGKFTKDGSHLKYCRSKGGAGAGLIAVGVLIAGTSAGLGMAIKDIMPPQNFVIFMVGGIGLGALLMVVGILMSKKRTSSYLSYYSNKNKYSKEEIESLDREIVSPGSVVVVNKSKVDSQSLLSGVIITEHWIKMPASTSLVSRMVDMAGIWFDPKPTYMGQTGDPQVCILSSQGELVFLTSDERYGGEVVSEALKRNPKMITSKRIEYEGVEYDCLNQYKEVAEIYRKAVRG